MAAQRCAGRIGQVSGGRLTVRLFATSEVVPAPGAFDGAKFVGPFSDAPLGLRQVAKNYYFPGVQEAPGRSPARRCRPSP